jgi:hypothetical protein
MSTKDVMQTLPSIEEVAMYMALDGTFGTIRAFGVRGFLEEASDVIDGVCFVGCA